MKIELAKLNFKKLFDNNKFVIVLSILIAIIAMFIVKLTVDPIGRRVIENVPITVQMDGTAANEAGLTSIPVEDMKVNVSVKGQRLIVSNLTADKISVIARPGNDVKTAGEYTLELTALNNDPNITYEITSLSKSKIKVRFDTFIEKEISVTAKTGKVEAADGFIIETPYTEPDTVKVTGPKTDVDRIAACVAEVDISGKLKETVTKEGTIQFLDKDNNKLEFDHVTCEPRKVDVRVPVYKQKTVPLTFDFINAPEGFPIDELKSRCKLNYSKITIATPNDAVDSLTEWNLGSIDFRKVGIGTKHTLNVTLPSGYRNVDNIDEVVVEFPTAGMSSKQLTIGTIRVANTPANYNVQLITKRLTGVRVVGPESIVESISAADIVATVDLVNYTVTSGQYSVPVTFSIPGKGMVWVSGEYTAVIKATAK